jgi:hypothetical protein
MRPCWNGKSTPKLVSGGKYINTISKSCMYMYMFILTAWFILMNDTCCIPIPIDAYSKAVLRRLNLMFDKTPFGSTTNIIFLFSSP